MGVCVEARTPTWVNDVPIAGWLPDDHGLGWLGTNIDIPEPTLLFVYLLMSVGDGNQ